MVKVLCVYGSGVWLKYRVWLCVLCISFIMLGLNSLCVLVIGVVSVVIGVLFWVRVSVILWMLVVGVNGLLFCRFIMMVLLV